MGNQQGHGGGESIVQPQGTNLAVAISVGSGTPTDASVPQPIDGALFVDKSGSKLWARINGAWKSTALS